MWVDMVRLPRGCWVRGPTVGKASWVAVLGREDQPSERTRHARPGGPMSALPRPDIATGPQLELVDALHNLHHRAGWPSLRTLAREAGCSHTTVSSAFSSPRLPRWGVLELLVEAMGGDIGSFRDLWLAASAPEPTGPSASSSQIAGRLAELVALRRHLLTGRGLLLVTGEAGIGKTKLVSTAVALRDGHPCVASGACLPLATSVPLLPVAELLRRVYEVDHGQWLKEAFAECAPYVADSLTRLVPELRPAGRRCGHPRRLVRAAALLRDRVHARGGSGAATSCAGPRRPPLGRRDDP